ncbi:MAG: P-type conjugative transfer protein TrbG [Burkholderiales bacterium]|nr:P-type conjugative transfer protein TrbG [Burkholderiales bacterium]
MRNKLILYYLILLANQVIARPNWESLNVPPLIDDNYVQNDALTQKMIRKQQKKLSVISNEAMVAIDESLKWQSGSSPRPLLKSDGVVRFPYGEYQPTVTCKPLNLCDIELQAGEDIQGILIGDSIRWNDGDQGIPVVYSGSANKLVPHLVLKPSQSGLETTLMVTTSKRTYMIKLRSANFGFVGRSGFYYPHEEMVNYSLSTSQIKKKSESITHELNPAVQKVLSGSSKLNYNYIIEDKSYNWRPIQAFDDGISVFIKMPTSIDSKNLPSICIINNNDYSHCELVNFRYVDNFYIIDKLFDKAKLVNGFDNNAETIMITSKFTKSLHTRRRFWAHLFGG